MKKTIVALFFAALVSLNFAVAADAQVQNRKLKIISKPRVRIGNCGEGAGVASLRVTFDKTAKITKVEVVRSSRCTEFDNNAIVAARGIKFEPEIRDGEAVTVVKPVEYRFERFYNR